jgi:hypothetical protein
MGKNFDKKIKKKSKIMTPQEACDLWVKESYSYDYKYFANPYPHRNIKLTPTESALLNELRN